MANAMGQDDKDGSSTPMEALTSYDLAELAQTLMGETDFKAAVADLPGKWDVRALTHAEWLTARDQGVLTLESGLTERLADGPASNHRGAMMDGRPRPSEVLGPAATQTAAIAVHPRNATITAVASVPSDRPSWRGRTVGPVPVRKRRPNGCPTTPTCGETFARKRCGPRCLASSRPSSFPSFGAWVITPPRAGSTCCLVGSVPGSSPRHLATTTARVAL